MTYAEQAAKAKADARDILRTQMAARIQTRISDAQSGIVSAIKALTNYFVRSTEEDEDRAKEATERQARRDAFGQALGSTEGLTPEELALVQDAVAKKQAENDEKLAAEAEDRAASRVRETKRLRDQVEAARKELAHHQENLAKLESGDLKVSADELEALTAKLLEDGRIEAGSVTETAPSAG